MFSQTEKKRIRNNLSKLDRVLSVPFLHATQVESYNSSLQATTGACKNLTGLQEAFVAIFPIVASNGLSTIEFVEYRIENDIFTIAECKQRGISYATSIYARLRLVRVSETGNIREISEQEVFVGELPIMTETGSFIINGTERVVVSQIHRSPGAFFVNTVDRMGRKTFAAKIMPYRGSWLEFQFDLKQNISVRIDKRHKFYATTLFRAAGLDTEQILDLFYDNYRVLLKHGYVAFKVEHLVGKTFQWPVRIGSTVIPADKKFTKHSLKKILEEEPDHAYARVDDQFLLDKVLALDIVVDSEVIANANDCITDALLARLHKLGVKHVQILRSDEITEGLYISNTLKADNCTDYQSALTQVYRNIYPKGPINEELYESVIANLFYNTHSYDLTDVGRAKLNANVYGAANITATTPEWYIDALAKGATSSRVLSLNDIIAVVATLIEVRNGRCNVDDIDSLSNRRVRPVGELIQNQFRVGLSYMASSAREKLSKAVDCSDIAVLLNSRSVTTSMKEFFASSQLSQFLDQTNPLSEITHKRRISALGPGGLTKDTTSFEVRDVHATHYGRLCPIETPEGPNIGLINSLAMYARLNAHGFIETPYIKIVKGRVTDRIDYLTADKEFHYSIAQANAKVVDGHLVDGSVSCRRNNEFEFASPDKIDYMDISPEQIVSVAAAMIPFLEHDDANRALMGSNMLRQAVPCLFPEKPLVGTGIERLVAVDSGNVLTAKRPGFIDYVDAKRIVVHVDASHTAIGDTGADLYILTKHARSNQNTMINQRPCVKVGDYVGVGDVLADGSATDLGEIALGQNMLVAFMPWHGFNFEDSILVSERVAAADRFTSIHIEEFSVSTRETKLGVEEITRDIPTLGESQLSKLDDVGIVCIGAKVKPGDVIVGKVTPKGETNLSPEDKLLRAIFGDKSEDVKDSSLRVPAGTEGTVIDVQVFTHDSAKRDLRAQSIIESQLAAYKQQLVAQLRIVQKNFVTRLYPQVLNQPLLKKDKISKAVRIADAKFLQSLSLNAWLNHLKFKSSSLNKIIDQERESYDRICAKVDAEFKLKRRKLTQGDSLPAGVQKTIKVYIAVKRQLQAGDKMAGRHGNKGVVSKIVPVEDMPRMKDGTPVDIVLNPLGVPSRMNIGQILEVHLGWAAKGLGERVANLVEAGDVADIRSFLTRIYQIANSKQDLSTLTDAEIVALAKNLTAGIPFATPVFSGADESVIRELLKIAYSDADVDAKGLTPSRMQAQLVDGQTGEEFERVTTVGYMNMLKLYHLVEDKMHARSTGPYSLVTQQPLGGKAQFGGQRFGEMEVWALEAYGAAHILQEMLTVKSDDIEGRNRTYEGLLHGEDSITPGVPESFNVLVHELQALGMSITLETTEK